MDDSQLKAGLDDVRAAVLALTDRLAISMRGLETASSELQELSSEMRKMQREMASHKATELPDSLLSLPLKVDATMASQARLVNTLDEMRHGLEQLSLQVEASATKSEKGGAVKELVGAALDEKLVMLAKIDAETLEQARRNGAELEEKLIPLATLGAETLEQTRRNNEALVKLVESQNIQNEVLGETLGALLELTEHVKARVEKLPEKKELEEEVERDIAKKLSE